MPRHVAELISMLDPVMRNAGDAPAGNSGSATGVIDLADNGVLGADCGSDGSRRIPDGRTTTVLVNRLQRRRRVRQCQLRIFGEKLCDSIESPVVDICGVTVY